MEKKHKLLSIYSIAKQDRGCSSKSLWRGPRSHLNPIFYTNVKWPRRLISIRGRFFTLQVDPLLSTLYMKKNVLCFSENIRTFFTTKWKLYAKKNGMNKLMKYNVSPCSKKDEPQTCDGLGCSFWGSKLLKKSRYSWWWWMEQLF